MVKRAPKWLNWAREIHALAHTGLHYARNPFDRERAERLLEIATEIVVDHSELTDLDVITAFKAQPGYVTPKVDVRAAVFNDGELLFVREAIDDTWTLPGGWADVGESPRTAIEREVLEEAGLHVRASRLVGVYDANRVEDALPLFHAYKLVFLCEPLSGELKPSSETLEVAYFSIEDLPKPLSKHRTTPQHIEDAIAAHQDPEWQVFFD